MEDKLLALRQEAEDSFTKLQTSLSSIKAELQKYGLETLEDGYAELNRLQGDFRAFNKVIDGTKESSETPADVIDTTPVDPPKAKK